MKVKSLNIKSITQKKLRYSLKREVVAQWFKESIPFSGSIVSRIKIGLLLGGILSFVLIVLEPFDTNQFQSNHRYLLLLGFGGILSILYFVHNTIEKQLYLRFGRTWSGTNEFFSVLLFTLVSGSILFLYNYFIVNQSSYSFQRHMWYYLHIVLPMSPLTIIPFLWFRKAFGERVVPIAKDSVRIIGNVSGEEVHIKRAQLIYIKADQNYVSVYHLDETASLSSTLLRLSLSKAHKQAPFLVKCHRSYLVNPSAVKEINGNSQKARILFSEIPDTVPLSKSYYKPVKEEFSFP